MAIYSTFFLCKSEELQGGFPEWRLPLVQPVGREVVNPFTGEVSTIETCEPEWPDCDAEDVEDASFGIVAIQGNYADYLEERLPLFVRTRPHWRAKDLTQIELTPLGDAANVRLALEDALFSPPWSGAMLEQIRPELLSKLVLLDEKGLASIAERWAATMSTPEYTHSVTGDELSDGWAPSDAIGILQPILRLAQQITDGQGMYLLIEA